MLGEIPLHLAAGAVTDREKEAHVQILLDAYPSTGKAGHSSGSDSQSNYITSKD